MRIDRDDVDGLLSELDEYAVEQALQIAEHGRTNCREQVFLPTRAGEICPLDRVLPSPSRRRGRGSAPPTACGLQAVPLIQSSQ